MAVGTPRFFINDLEWLDATGYAPLLSDYLRTLPVNVSQFEGQIDFTIPYSLINPYVALLGIKDFGDLYAFGGSLASVETDAIKINENMQYDGWSLLELDSTPYSFFSDSASIGSVIIGSYYTMTKAPNLSLKISHDYGGTKEFTTINGSSMSNTMWSKPPKWGSLGAWELADEEDYGLIPALSRTGRRTWDLKFSFIDDGDLWGSNQSLTFDAFVNETSGITFDPTTDLQDSGNFTYNLLSDDNFFSQVWSKTLGSALPFLMQQDSTNYSPDQFAICRFADDSLEATQSAFNVYDISLKIEEVW